MKFKDCKAELNDNILILENSAIRRVYDWNKGNLISKSIEDLSGESSWELLGNECDMELPGLSGEASEPEFKTYIQNGDGVFDDYLAADITIKIDDLYIKRHFKLFPETPAISCVYFLKGRVESSWKPQEMNAGNLEQIENSASAAQGERIASTIERLELSDRHVAYDCAQFFDITDRRNNLVREVSGQIYNAPHELDGQLLVLKDIFSSKKCFILKEAPCSDIQLSSEGYNFGLKKNEVKLVGIGLESEDIPEDEWVRCYGFATGIATGDDTQVLKALRKYQKNLRSYHIGRDNTIMQNTWGDRGQDSKITEEFCLRELEAAAKLGITHFQIDDGWQEGLSQNSAFEGGTFKGIWEREDYWHVNKERFPNGLKPVTDKAKELGVEVCLWFNPCIENNFGHWENDADTMIRLYKEHGVRIFKIDGVNILEKEADVNLRKMFDKALVETDHNIALNLDLTAYNRFGYHYFNEYGNKFLENRYTDWENFYPHWTLRNLWMLSKYVPAEMLQIEFLNKWRNADKYSSSDPLAPSNISFEYQFAQTMFGQPLAWFEGSNLPEESHVLEGVIATYKQHQAAIHNGTILPIGNEPTGAEWTGLQSIDGNKGYVIVFRQFNSNDTAKIALRDLAGKVSFTKLLGAGESFEVDVDGEVEFTLPTAHSYSLYKYEVK